MLFRHRLNHWARQKYEEQIAQRGGAKCHCRWPCLLAAAGCNWRSLSPCLVRFVRPSMSRDENETIACVFWSHLNFLTTDRPVSSHRIRTNERRMRTLGDNLPPYLAIVSIKTQTRSHAITINITKVDQRSAQDGGNHPCPDARMGL